MRAAGWAGCAAIRDRETHGRWPWVAAGAAMPATVLAARSDDPLAWAPLPALLWHQTEEWVWPGGFLPWFNREVAGSDDDEYPITRRLGFAINVGLGWGTAVAAARLDRRWLSAWVAATNAANFVLHAREAIAARRYNPGLVTASGLLAPVAAAGLARVQDRRQLAAGLALGTATGVGVFAAMRRRVRA